MTTAWDALVARGCLCGTDHAVDCTLHGPGDNRGLAAWFKAGMPAGFPMQARCAICHADGLMYPSVELDRGEVPAGSAPGPTLVCPRCSKPPAERRLVGDAVEFGYELNNRRVFGSAA